MAEGFQYFYKN